MKTRPEIIDGPDGYDELDIDVWLFDSSYHFFFSFSDDASIRERLLTGKISRKARLSLFNIK